MHVGHHSGNLKYIGDYGTLTVISNSHAFSKVDTPRRSPPTETRKEIFRHPRNRMMFLCQLADAIKTHKLTTIQKIAQQNVPIATPSKYRVLYTILCKKLYLAVHCRNRLPICFSCGQQFNRAMLNVTSKIGDLSVQLVLMKQLCTSLAAQTTPAPAPTATVPAATNVTAASGRKKREDANFEI